MKFMLKVYGAAGISGIACAIVCMSEQQRQNFIRLRDMFLALRKYEILLYSFEVYDSLPNWYSIIDNEDLEEQIINDEVITSQSVIDEVVTGDLHTELEYAIITEDGVHWTCMEKHNTEDRLETVNLPWSMLEKIDGE